MPSLDSRGNMDFSIFDAMSSAELEGLLRSDSKQPDNEKSDIDAILYIMEVLARRKKESENGEGASEVDRAWASFNDNYRPDTREDTPLYQSETVSPDAADSAPSEPVSDHGEKRRRGFVRFIISVAAVLALVLAGSVASYASGFDLWGALGGWTQEVFGFEGGRSKRTTCRSGAA